MRRYLFALPMLLAVLAFAACGDDSSKESEAPAPTEAATEAPTDAPTEAPTEAATDEPTGGGSGSGDVKVTGKLGEKPTIKTPGGDPPTELVIKDIKKGKGDAARAGQNVSMQYVGALWSDGSVFDNSWDRGQPFDFSLGGQQVIAGWDEGIVGMKPGGRRLLIIPPDKGYGGQDNGPIPANSTLVFVVDLDKISSP
jgi:peptidylprolyl isomerase